MDDLEDILNSEDMPDFSDEDAIDPVERATLERLSQIGEVLQALQHSIQGLVDQISRPKRVVRGPDNRVIGIE